MRDLRSRYGPWALVTGASSGIGKEFAVQLAEFGLNLVLVARRESLLNTLANSLSHQHGILTKVIPIDLRLPGAVDSVAEQSSGLEIGLLVNNAGVELHGLFLDHDAAACAGLVQLNAVVPTQMAHRFGNLMRKHGRGGIIFVSSLTGYTGSPYLASYSATKAYLISLSESLSYELRKEGVDVTVVVPGVTRTPMVDAAARSGVDFSRIPFPLAEAAPVVRAGLGALGNTPCVIPGVGNNLIGLLLRRILSRKQAAHVFGWILERAIQRPARRIAS